MLCFYEVKRLQCFVPFLNSVIWSTIALFIQPAISKQILRLFLFSIYKDPSELFEMNDVLMCILLADQSQSQKYLNLSTWALRTPMIDCGLCQHNCV